MPFSLSPELQQQIEERMKRDGFPTPEDVVRTALETMDQVRAGETLEELDADTLSAIEDGLAQSDRGEGRPWAEVRDEFRTRFIK